MRSASRKIHSLSDALVRSFLFQRMPLPSEPCFSPFSVCAPMSQMAMLSTPRCALTPSEHEDELVGLSNPRYVAQVGAKLLILLTQRPLYGRALACFWHIHARLELHLDRSGQPRAESVVLHAVTSVNTKAYVAIAV